VNSGELLHCSLGQTSPAQSKQNKKKSFKKNCNFLAYFLSNFT
jgi:hypothetical protein